MTLYLQAKLVAEFKEKTVPNMFGVIQKHIKDGHFIGSDGVCMCSILVLLATYICNMHSSGTESY